MLPQLSLFQQCSIQSQDVMQTWLHWRRQDALLVQKHFVALFHPKPNECLRFDLESCNFNCTYIVVTHPCHIPPLTQARPMMLCIYTSFNAAVMLLLSCLLSYMHLYKNLFANFFLSFCNVRTSHTMQVSENKINNLSIGRGPKGRGRRKEGRKGKERGEEG